MKLVADSGSTKTQWYAINSEAEITLTIQTQGYNPYYYTTIEILKSLKEELLPQLEGESIETLYFYGAGCSSEQNQDMMRKTLGQFFTKASIDIGTDLLAAARATAGHEEGICCILGTGANSCYYDGNQIIDNLPPLGYILGDEGSGASLGKMIIQAYYYREMSEYLAAKLSVFANMDRHHLLEKLFNETMPSRFLASFANFAVENQEDASIQELIARNFDLFIQKHLLKYKKSRALPVHFIGSIAHGFQDILEACLSANELTLGNVYQTPFPTLLEY